MVSDLDLGDTVEVSGSECQLIGYTADGQVIVSPINDDLGYREFRSPLSAVTLLRRRRF